MGEQVQALPCPRGEDWSQGHSLPLHIAAELFRTLSLSLCLIFIFRERHSGSFDIVHVKDSNGHVFATRLGYVFIIGKGNKPYISLPKGKGIKLTIAEERDKRLAS